MIKTQKFSSHLSLLVFFVFSSSFGLEKLDGIVAFVGDSIILESELNAYILLKSGGLSDSVIDSSKLNQMRKTALNELIEGKVLLVRAEKDTNISLSENEIDAQLNNRINMILSQNNMTVSQFEQALKTQQGITLEKFRRELRKQIRQSILKQKVQQHYVSSAPVSKSDVEQFYQDYKDSLPSAGKSVLLSKITIAVSPSDSIKQQAFEKISAIKQRIDNGEEFEDVARKFSQGPNAAGGGDLGFISKGTLSELAFEEKIFSMQPGEISKPIQTNIGFHIAYVQERKEHMVHVKQIFIAVNPLKENLDNARDLLDSIRNNCKSEKDFIEAVEKFSTDKISKSRNGRLRWQEVSSLNPVVQKTIDTLSEGEISIPLRVNNEFSIYRVNDRKENRRLTLEDDWDEISDIAQKVLTQKKLLDLVKKWRQETFIDIRI